MKLSFKNTMRAALVVLAISAQFATTHSLANGDAGQQQGTGQAKPLIISSPTTIQGCNAGLVKEPSTGVYVCSSYYQTGTPPPNVIPGASGTVWWIPGSVDGVNMPAPVYYGGGGSGSDGNGGGCSGGCNGTVTDGSGASVTDGSGNDVSSTGDGSYSSSGGGGW